MASAASTPAPYDPSVRTEIENLHKQVSDLTPERTGVFSHTASNISQKRIDGIRDKAILMLADPNQKFQSYAMDLVQIVKAINIVDQAFKKDNETEAPVKRFTKSTENLSDSVEALKTVANKVLESAPKPPQTREEFIWAQQLELDHKRYNEMEKSLKSSDFLKDEAADTSAYFKSNADKKFVFLADNPFMPVGSYKVAINKKSGIETHSIKLGSDGKSVTLSQENPKNPTGPYLQTQFSSLVLLKSYLNNSEMDRDASEARLKNSPTGAYLLRPSSRPGQMAISIKKEQGIAHGLLYVSEKGIEVDFGKKNLDGSPAVLDGPYKNLDEMLSQVSQPSFFSKPQPAAQASTAAGNAAQSRRSTPAIAVPSRPEPAQRASTQRDTKSTASVARTVSTNAAFATAISTPSKEKATLTTHSTAPLSTTAAQTAASEAAKIEQHPSFAIPYDITIKFYAQRGDVNTEDDKLSHEQRVDKNKKKIEKRIEEINSFATSGSLHDPSIIFHLFENLFIPIYSNFTDDVVARSEIGAKKIQAALKQLLDITNKNASNANTPEKEIFQLISQFIAIIINPSTNSDLDNFIKLCDNQSDVVKNNQTYKELMQLMTYRK